MNGQPNCFVAVRKRSREDLLGSSLSKETLMPALIGAKSYGRGKTSDRKKRLHEFEKSFPIIATENAENVTRIQQ